MNLPFKELPSVSSEALHPTEVYKQVAEFVSARSRIADRVLISGIAYFNGFLENLIDWKELVDFTAGAVVGSVLGTGLRYIGREYGSLIGRVGGIGLITANKLNSLGWFIF